MMRNNFKYSAIFLLVMCIAASICAGFFANQRNMLNKELAVIHNELEQAQTQYTFEKSRADGLSTSLGNMNHELKEANMTIQNLKDTEATLVYLGDFKITYYCDERFSHICGGSGVTASGKPTEVGATIAVDKTVIPLGTTVYVEGIGYMEAQDTGGAVIGNHIDILVEDHYTAEQLGVQYGGVWILIEK